MHEIQFSLRPARRDRKAIHAPESGRGRLPRVTEVLALALQFEDLIRRGLAKDYADLARLGCLSKERVSQIMRLIWLAPDLQQEVLMLPRTPRGRFPVNEVTLRRIASMMLWTEQREAWGRLPAQNPR
jgi:hypothetical protein